MEYKLLATKASIITVTRSNLAELQKAMRRILSRMENFIIADVEYTMDDTGDKKSYSAIIMGALPDGYVDINDDGENQGEEPPVVVPTPEPQDPEEPGKEDELEDKLKDLEERQNETTEMLNEMKDSMAEILAYIEALKAKETDNG